MRATLKAAMRALAVAGILFGGDVATARAQMTIEVTSGVTHPVPIAVAPFPEPRGAATDVADVIQHDLSESGRFSVLSRERMPATPSRAAQVSFPAWKGTGSDYLVVGRVTPVAGGQLAVDFNLLNVLTGRSIARERFTGTPAALRNAAHRASNVIYQAITGIRGAFDTHIAYVALVGQGAAQRFQLVVADADGYNHHRILESRFPIMSPAWSPDGKWLAYVSFEDHLSAVYRQRVRTGQRWRVSARAGVNGAPAWSPDGRKLALTLSGVSGYPQIYILDLQTQKLTRVTHSPAINTEPAWAPDGQSLYFTSDRAGAPQIYHIGVSPGSMPQRITFTDNYNAGPHVSPDGKWLAMVTRVAGSYRIAAQNLATGQFKVLTRGPLDQSPSFAPNGATIIYAARPGEGDAGTLATISIDGLTGITLKRTQGAVRDPAWGPFAR